MTLFLKFKAHLIIKIWCCNKNHDVNAGHDEIDDDFDDDDGDDD